MSLINRAAATTLVLASVALAGCAGDGGMENLFTTGSLGTQTQSAAAEQKIDPACVTLASRIETLRREGVGEKLEKAAAKKYKLTQADLTKADQLAKADADFQSRCSTIVMKSAGAYPSPAPEPAPPPAAKPKASPKAASAAVSPPPQN